MSRLARSQTPEMTLFPRTLSLRHRLTLLLLVASVPGMAVAVVLAVNALAVQSNQIEQMATHLAALQAAQHTTVTESARIMLDTLIESDAIAQVDEVECGAFLSDWIERYPSFTALALIDASGEVLCSSMDNDLPFDPAGRPWFAQLKSEKDFTVGQYAVGREGTPMVMAGQPVLDSQGAFKGAVAVGIDLRWLEFLAGRVDLPARTTVTALGSDGQVLVHHVAASETAPADPASDPVPSEALRMEMATLGTGTVRGLNDAREPRAYGFHRTDSGDLVVAVGMPPYLEFARYGAALRDTLMAPLTILVLALLAAWWGAEWLITRWVRSLTRTTREVARGDLSVRSKVPHGTYEIGQLAAAFDAMASNIEESQRRLRQAVSERETLLRELNHRVKNNLQMVVSLLNLHARRIPDPGVRGEFRDISGRIRTLSVIHELLYQGDPARPTSLPDYVERLCQALHDLYQVQPSAAEIETRLEPVSLPLDQAIPFGMILNELVSNAYKHAFPEDRSGRVEIRLVTEADEAGERTLHLSVSDTGTGPPPDFDVASSPSMGLKVAQALAESLGGTLAFERQPGLSVFHLQFPLKAGGAS
jgi:two-component sensor histidine kinase